MEGKDLKKFIVVRNYNDTNILLGKNYQLQKIDRDKNDRSKLIFLFNYDKKILAELDKISYNKSK